MQGRKLTQDEVTAIETKAVRKAGDSRRVKVELYDALAVDFNAGDYGELTLGIDEKKPTIRKNFAAAVARKGLKIDWRRGGKDTLRFQVTE